MSPAFENATTYTQMFTIANTLSGGLLVYALVVTAFSVFFLSTIAFGRNRSLQFASLMTGLLLLILNNMGMIDYWLIVADVLIFAISTFMLQQKKNEYGG